MSTKIYAQRMLNPFHGVVNVVESEGADAVSRDGVTWTLYVHGERDSVSENGREYPVETPDIRFGTWTASDGLRRAPVRSTDDYEIVDFLGLRLLDRIRYHLNELPFPLADRWELWLLEAESRLPIALIGSACKLEEINLDAHPVWQPGQQARHRFRAPEGAREATDRRPADCDCIARQVHGATGRPATAQWLERQSDGSARGGPGIHMEEALEGRRLEADAFPELLITQDWPDTATRTLVQAFLDWQAPWLLLLQHLSEPTRARLEAAASSRAETLAAQYRLYPRIIDPRVIRAALVEARLRSAASVGRAPEETTLSPFYLEV